MKQLIHFLFVSLSLSFQTQTKETQSLKVMVTGMQNDKGQIEFWLFNTSEGFPDQLTKAYKTKSSKITHGTSFVSFENIPYGQYAVGIYHDENENKKLDQTWYRMPKEGIGVSNNPAIGIFSPPDFSTARFTFEVSKDTIVIRIKYL